MKYNDWLAEEVLKVLTENLATSGATYHTQGTGGGRNTIYTPDDQKVKDPNEEEMKHDRLGEDEDAGLDVSRGKKFMMILPKFTPSEAWGDPGSRERKEIQDLFTRATWGGASGDDGQKGIQNKLNNLLAVAKKTSNAGPRKIISTLILLESLAAVVNSFSASSAGFVFEGFLAALLEGKQEAEVSAKGNLPIQDLIAFSGEGDLNIPVSLKLLVDSTDVKGSYTNLVDALDEFGQMVYIVAYKRKAAGGGLDISINQFKLDQNNFMEAITKGKRKDAHALFAPKNGKRTAESNYKLIKSQKNWEDKYALLQQTAGYNRKVKANPKIDDASDDIETTAASTVDPKKLENISQMFTKAGIKTALTRVTRGNVDFYDAVVNSAALKKDYVMAFLAGTKTPYRGTNSLKLARDATTPEGKTIADRLRNAFPDLQDLMTATLKESTKRIYTVEENRKLLSEARLDEADKGGRQWNISTTQLAKTVKDIVGFETIGALPGTTEQIEAIAESYADLLTEQLEILFESVGSLSKNVNTYFTATKRDQAAAAGKAAEESAHKAEESMRAAQSEDKEDLS